RGAAARSSAPRRAGRLRCVPEGASGAWSPHQQEDDQPRDHRREAREADLPVGHLRETLEGLPPHLGGGKREDSFEHEHEGKSRDEDFRHFPRPGFLRYLKKSELGSSTITSLFERSVWRYASRLR